MSEPIPDAVIVGAGAGGAAMAWSLCRAGWQVLLLERGPDHAREDYQPDEISVLREGFLQPDQGAFHWVSTGADGSSPFPSTLGWTASCVGGGTVHMGGFLYRFHPVDFRMRSIMGDVPDLADWPFSYQDLEPYYQTAEGLIGVAGDGSTRYVPRSGPHPLPPLAAHPLSERLRETCTTMGLAPFVTPRAVNSIAYQGRPACQYCDACAGYGCPIGAKGSAQETLVRSALRTGRLQLRTGMVASEICLDRTGKADAVICIDRESRQSLRFRGRHIIVSCSAVESARLLLLSRSGRYPDGLGNDNGLVGRHLQFHGTTFGSARLERLGDWHPFLNLSVADYYLGGEGLGGLPKGGMLRFDMLGRLPLRRALDFLGRQPAPLWGEQLVADLRRELGDFDRIEYEAFHDYLPSPGTWVGLDEGRLDGYGLPSAHIRLDSCALRRRSGELLAERAAEILGRLGADDIVHDAVGATSSYLVHGSCRAGDDPETSVLDPWCRVHAVPNLHVVDGSFMPTSGGASPTLTIVANALRVGHHLVKS
ncbi:MAG: GMC family oxidoreductase [Wenzhouxiangella sp.]|nr:GMC family oxidoreductase [Wenzhouxiangella sp.]TVR97579.1 MAG: GMC family oxidoreductase [Wenzhouxiangellaceae bacterium]